jgi:hypothetical protein
MCDLIEDFTYFGSFFLYKIEEKLNSDITQTFTGSAV